MSTLCLVPVGITQNRLVKPNMRPGITSIIPLKERTTIGSSDTADIQLLSCNSARVELSIIKINGKFYVNSTQSKPSIFLNGKPVLSDSAPQLKPNDLILILSGDDESGLGFGVCTEEQAA